MTAITYRPIAVVARLDLPSSGRSCVCRPGRMDAEYVAMRPVAWRRTGPSVPGATKAVANRLAAPLTGPVCHSCGHVVQHPMGERSSCRLPDAAVSVLREKFQANRIRGYRHDLVIGEFTRTGRDARDSCVDQEDFIDLRGPVARHSHDIDPNLIEQLLGDGRSPQTRPRAIETLEDIKRTDIVTLC